MRIQACVDVFATTETLGHLRLTRLPQSDPHISTRRSGLSRGTYDCAHPLCIRLARLREVRQDDYRRDSKRAIQSFSYCIAHERARVRGAHIASQLTPKYSPPTCDLKNASFHWSPLVGPLTCAFAGLLMSSLCSRKDDATAAVVVEGYIRSNGKDSEKGCE